MMAQPKYLRNRFSVSFQRQPRIRRKTNEFEDFLHETMAGHYSQPQTIPVPDEMEPEIPRIIFDSTHGFSRIIISQVTIALEVSYSPDWQVDIGRGQSYLHERITKLYELIRMMDDAEPLYAGLSTIVQVPMSTGDDGVVRLISERCLRVAPTNALYDVRLHLTEVIDDTYFNNRTVQNYRTWRRPEAQHGHLQLARKDAIERGVQVSTDFNDRYSYNEKPQYKSSDQIGIGLLGRGFGATKAALDDILTTTRGASNE